MINMNANRCSLTAEILERSRRLRSPKNYWKGKPDRPIESPTNILLFHRTQAVPLMASPHRQHHRFILIVNLGGDGKVGVDAQMHSLAEGQSLLIFPFQSHFYAELAAKKIHWTFVSFEHPAEEGLNALRNHGAFSTDEESLIHLRNLLRTWQPPSRQDMLPLHLELWLQEMRHKVAASPKAKTSRRKLSHTDEDLVERVNHFLFSNRHSAISLDEIAGKLGFSVSLLRMRFRSTTGRSIGRHAREIRLNYACELLHETQSSIETVAGQCGYESVFTFSRAFFTAYGSYPSHYRKAKTIRC